MTETLSFCLDYTAYREADVIATFYTQELGLIRAVVSGVKKSTSKLSGSVLRLTQNKITVKLSQSLHRVTAYERVWSYPQLHQSVESMAVATTAGELMKLMGQENESDSYAMFEVLAGLHQLLDKDTQTPLHWIQHSLQFHTQLLGLSGYAFQYDACALCLAVLDLSHTPVHGFSPTHGGLLCQACYHQHHHATSVLVKVSTSTLLLLLNPHDRRFYSHAIKAHRFLMYWWHYCLERPLKSVEFLIQTIQMSAQTVNDPQGFDMADSHTQEAIRQMNLQDKRMLNPDKRN